MIKRTLFAMLPAVALMASANPARAAVSATIAPQPYAHVGACPADLLFHANVSTDAPADLDYRFVRSDGSIGPPPQFGHSHQHFSTPGSDSVIDEFRASKSGWDLLEVFDSNTRALLARVRARYTLLCVVTSSNVPSRPSGYSGVTVSSSIAVPTGFTAATSSGACLGHASATTVDEACSAALSAQERVMIWNWDAGACQAAPCISGIDGFHVYRFVGKAGNVELMTTLYSGRRVTVVSFTDPGGSCFVVRAYKAQVESADSNAWCPP